MARQATVIDKSEFQNVVTSLEGSQTFPNLSALWKAVGGAAWSGAGKSPSFYHVRASQLGIACRTEAGRKGFSKGHVHTNAPRKRKNRTNYNISIMKDRAPISCHNLIDKVAKGSLSAAIKLHCLECCGFDRKAVRECTALACPLYQFRPYQSAIVDSDEVSEEMISHE